ncbi:MAG: 4Fe-4S dicluster domain-containing protein [Muribaculaceae bacterium]
MLRKIRITLAAIFFIAITLCFLDFTGTIRCYMGWMEKLQFVPAVLALNVVVIVSLLVLTLLFGRVYCSVICPLGVMQDVISWLHNRSKKARVRFGYSRPLTWLRCVFLALFVVLILMGFTSIAALIAPYSAFGRIAANILAPIYSTVNNYLAAIAEHYDSYAFYSIDVWLKSGLSLAVALVTLAVIFVLAWRGGRTYCNTVCPVGTVLGFFARFSLFRPVINTDKCVGCTLCARKCKASCIDAKNHKIDYSRCVACMDCLENCSSKAITMELRGKKQASEVAHQGASGDAAANEVKSRRTFLTLTSLFAIGAAVKAQESKVDGGLAVIEDKQIPARKQPIVPPGALSIAHLRQHCTACQLCIAACPNGVLRPSTDLQHLMQPVMSYERGYCRPECNECSQTCPSGAIKPIDLPEKTSIQIGHAVWIAKNCIVNTDGVQCGNCARHCPNGAIKMMPKDPNDAESPLFPVVDAARCIGCGACEYVCPARPFSAIYVEGNAKHREV